jgi:hypothetical protein
VLRCISRWELLQQMASGMPTDAALFAGPRGGDKGAQAGAGVRAAAALKDQLRKHLGPGGGAAGADSYTGGQSEGHLSTSRPGGWSCSMGTAVQGFDLIPPRPWRLPLGWSRIDLRRVALHPAPQTPTPLPSRGRQVNGHACNE